jgi:hypothetical protein
VVRSEEYNSVLQDDAAPPLARQFHCRALIESALGRNGPAFSNMLAAAWTADDVGELSQAKAYRSGAADFLRSGPELRSEQKLQLADVLRRAENWEDAQAVVIELISSGLSDERLQAVAKFQLGLIKQFDSAGYAISEALRSTAA